MESLTDDGIIAEVDIVTDLMSGRPVLHGLSKVEKALTRAGIKIRRITAESELSGNPVIVASADPQGGVAHKLAKDIGDVALALPESLSVQPGLLGNLPAVSVTGADDTGLMYGLQEVARQIELAGSDFSPFAGIGSVMESPFIAVQLQGIN